LHNRTEYPRNTSVKIGGFPPRFNQAVPEHKFTALLLYQLAQWICVGITFLS